MKNTLLLRLAGPMQSWGTNSRYTYRETDLEPSKSGVIGLLCAALGKPRDELHPDNQHKPKLAELAALRMGVRVDRPGVLLVDYHTVGGRHLRKEVDDNYGVLKADGKISRDAVVSHRFYLADARFLIGLESEDEELLKTLWKALRRPRWQLCLGRKAFVPSEPVWFCNDEWPQVLHEGVCPMGLRLALEQFSWLGRADEHYPEKLRVVIEPDTDEQDAFEARHDVPLSFVKGKRQFTKRQIKTEWVCPRKEALNVSLKATT